MQVPPTVTVQHPVEQDVESQTHCPAFAPDFMHSSPRGQLPQIAPPTPH